MLKPEWILILSIAMKQNWQDNRHVQIQIFIDILRRGPHGISRKGGAAITSPASP